MSHEPERAEKTVPINVDVSGLLNGLWKVQAAILFSWNPDLVELDDELDIMYRGQI